MYLDRKPDNTDKGNETDGDEYELDDLNNPFDKCIIEIVSLEDHGCEYK